MSRMLSNDIKHQLDEHWAVRFSYRIIRLTGAKVNGVRAVTPARHNEGTLFINYNPSTRKSGKHTAASTPRD